MFKVDDVVWTCQVSLEDNNYDHYNPYEPFQVKITKIDEDGVWANAFNKDTGEIDYDLNASYCGSIEQFFSNYKDAAKHYKLLVLEEIKELYKKIRLLTDSGFKVIKQARTYEESTERVSSGNQG